MLRRLRLRRSTWAAIAVGLLVAPVLMGGATATSVDPGDQLPPPEPDPRETPPPDRAAAEAKLALAQAAAISDLAPEEFRHMVVAAADRHKLDPRLLAAIITVETEWNAQAVGRHGELGLMQILPETGAFLAEQAGLTHYNLADSATNLALGALYLSELIREHGTIQNALAAYNGGPDAVAEAAVNLYAQKVLKRYRTQPGNLSAIYEAAS